MFHSLRATCVSVLLALLAACGGGGPSIVDDDRGGGGGGESEMFRARALAASDGMSDGNTMHLNNMPPTAGVVASPAFGTVCGLFSFNLTGVPRNRQVVRATLRVFRASVIGSPELVLNQVVLDHIDAEAGFPLDFCTRTPLDAFIGVLATGNDRTIGWRSVDVTRQVQTDLASGRSTSQYRVRGASANASIQLTLPPPRVPNPNPGPVPPNPNPLPPPIGSFSFGDAESAGGIAPYIEIELR